MNWVTATFGWTYLVVTLGILIFLVFLAFSPAGAWLGKDTDRPEFSTMTWFAMILSAVMGIGLVSYGVAEPISHFGTPPHELAEPARRPPRFAPCSTPTSTGACTPGRSSPCSDSRSRTRPTARAAGPSSASCSCRPRDRVNGPLGKAIDVLAVFATLFGTTTSLGLGALQVNNGLGSLVRRSGQLGHAGADHRRRHRRLHDVRRDGRQQGHQVPQPGSAALAVALFVFILVVGPTVFIANLYIESVGTWATDFFRMSLQGTAFGGLEWMQGGPTS